MLFIPPSMPPTAAQDSEVPAWIKNNAGWWAEGQIDDSSFLQGIQFLIKEGIMVIPSTETSGSSGSEGVPAWIKNNAGWWADGQIDDGSFVSGIQWLISNGIIIIEQEESIPSGTGIDLVYQTKVVSKTPHTVAVIYSTQNDTCSADEKEKAKAYGIMVEYLVSKTPRSDPTQVTAYCIQLHEITGGTYPLVLKQMDTNLPKLLIFVGGLEANLESYDIKSSVWWWSCNWSYGGPGPSGGWQCKPNQIVVCDECKRWGVNMPNLEDDMADGMWRLSAAIGGVTHHEVKQIWDYEYGDWAYRTSIWDNQDTFDLCYEFDILENKSCSKLYEEVTVLGETYKVMDINYAKRNWEVEQKAIKKEIISITGVGSKFEGFSKFQLREDGVQSESALTSSTGDVEVTDFITIEYPDDWSQDYYKYDWEIWNTKSSKSFECCHVFQAYNATLRVAADLWKDDTRKEGPQYPWVELGSMALWFLDNVHYSGTNHEERFDALGDAVKKYCDNASFKMDHYECVDFKILEKSVFATDEGRTAYSLTWSYSHLWHDPAYYGIQEDPWIVTTSEVHLGEDAWQVWTFWLEDVYEYSGDEIERFNKSLTILDTNTPIPSVPVTSSTVLTEDGIQYTANRIWEEDLGSIGDEEDRGFLTNQTKITKYDVSCGADCDITFSENMDVDELMTKIWNGTDREFDDWWFVEYGNPLNPNAGKVWDKENEEWVAVAEDKWIYESTSMKRFQDEKLVKQVWDIYHSITPKQIIEEIDTFLLEATDSGLMAYVARCADEADAGCGPPDTPNSKYVIGFSPVMMAPTSGEWEAKLQPGKIKDALETQVLKRTLVHENAHILTLGESQSDNDMINWSEYCDDRFDDGSINWEECDDDEIRRVTMQKETACVPNFYDPRSGCTKDNSYMNKFFQKFWVDIYSEHSYGGKKITSTYEFHKKYYDQFVTYYAASHPAEDIAESFSAFVLWDDQTIDNQKKWCKDYGWNLVDQIRWKWCQKGYQDNSMWEEKILFFYDFPELVEMRDFIRSNL